MSLVARITSLAQRDAMTTIGIALSAVWLLLIGLFWFLAPGGEGSGGALGQLAVVTGAILPLALIWLAVGLGRSIAMLKAEAQDLRLRLGQMREAADIRPEPSAPRPAPQAGQPQPQPARAMAQVPGTPVQPAPRNRVADTRQAALRFEAPPESQPVDPETLVLALDFPDGPEDHEAIAALRQALKDQSAARTLRAAQDVVTLLAARGVYMDDLPPEPAAPASLWRRFASGDRSEGMAGLDGIHEAQAIGITRDFLHRDEIFRDSAHHFLRHFDGTLVGLIPQLDDAQVAALAQTRSARAFLLLGKLAGIFAETGIDSGT
jgi:hypothetical protein